MFSSTLFSQILIEKEIKGELNIETKSFQIEINNEIISGILTDQKVKDLRFYTIEKGENILVVRLGDIYNSINTNMELIKLSSNPGNIKIFDIYYLNESYKNIKKTLKKQGFEGLENLKNNFSSNNYGNIWVDKREFEYDEKTELESFIGVYKIKIYKTGSYTLKSDAYGKLIVTKEGITIETEVPSIDLLRSTHDKSSQFNKPSKGNFWCKLSKNYYENIMVSLNDRGSGSFTTLRGSTTNTTIFFIVE